MHVDRSLDQAVQATMRPWKQHFTLMVSLSIQTDKMQWWDAPE